MNNKARVLIAEGRAPLSLRLKDIVEKAGFEAVVAYTGQVALSQARVMRPDLVVLSDHIGPPGPSETARRIKEDPATGGIPIVILATTPEETEALNGSYPVEACLPVTTNPADLTNVIRLLAGSTSRRTKNGQPSVGLEGTLQGNLLPELLEFLFVTKKTGRVAISDGERRGAIYVDAGNVLHAEFDDARGQDAFYRVCFLGRGYFKFEQGVRASVSTMRTGGVGLLLEAAKQLDDLRRSRQGEGGLTATRVRLNFEAETPLVTALAESSPAPPPRAPAAETRRVPVVEAELDLELEPLRRAKTEAPPPVVNASAEGKLKPEPLAASTPAGLTTASGRFRPAVTAQSGPHPPQHPRRRLPRIGQFLWPLAVLLVVGGGLVGAFVLGRNFPARVAPQPDSPAAPSPELPWEGARHDVSIDSEPQGAQILIDGHEVGFTPVPRMSLKRGSYLVRLQRDGWEPLQREVVITADVATHNLNFTLTPVVTTDQATLILRVIPAGAAVYVNGQKLAPSPSPPKFDPGTYRVEVKAKGFESWSGQVELRSGATRELGVTLRRLRADSESETADPYAEAVPPPEPELPLVEPVKLSGDSPSYPKDARDRRLKGSVLVEIEVDEEGAVAAVNVLESAGDFLDQAVVSAIRTWRFQPATRGGVPVRGSVQWRHSFR
jgi:TonB family protein